MNLSANFESVAVSWSTTYALVKVVNDKKTLTNYLREQHENWGDLPSYGQINIWDGNINIEEGGTFRFGWNRDGSKCLPDETITADLR